MIDISHKKSSLRTAVAQGSIIAAASVIERVKNGTVPKGDVLATARAAGIQAAKRTSDWITFCHPMPLDYVDLSFELGETEIRIEATVRAVWKTGVEMEAMTAVQAAALNMYDMLKPLDENLTIGASRLVKKRGGKSDFADRFHSAPRAAVLVISDSTHAGTRRDKAGRAVSEFLVKQGVDVAKYDVLPDEAEQIAVMLRELADDHSMDFIFTAGGTGFGARDVTPEAISQVIDRTAPGIAEQMRSYGFDRTPFAMLSRQVCGLRGRTLIVSLPGSTAGATESVQALFPGLLHAIPMMHDLGHSSGIKHNDKQKNQGEK